MKPIDHIKSCFTFWEPSVARKITLYFTFFGCLIFYVTSAVHLKITQKHLAMAVKQLVQHQIALVPGSQESQFWRDAVDRKRPELRALAELLLSLTHTAHELTDVSIYTRIEPGQPWQRLRLDTADVLRVAPTDQEMTEKLDANDRWHPHLRGSYFFISKRMMTMLVKLTEAEDPGNAFIQIDILCSGMAGLFFSRWIFWIVISPLALIVIRVISYLIAQALARPVEALSFAADQVAKGDLSIQIPPLGKTELGALGHNFNKMIHGLREWQKVKVIEMELEKGRAIQQDFLPSQIPCPPHWDIATCFYPAREVSGDFYDVFDLPGGNVGLVIADVCDKGVGSALYMALIRSLIRVYAEQALNQEVNRSAAADESDLSVDGLNGLSAVTKTNQYLSENHSRECMFATLFFGILNPKSGHLVYHNCGHEPLYIVGPNGLKSELLPNGPAVGIIAEAQYRVGTRHIDPGELLLGLTDGVTEARNLSDELFTRKRLKQLLTQPAKSAGGLLEKIRKQLFEFVGAATDADDVTMLAVQRLEVSPAAPSNRQRLTS